MKAETLSTVREALNVAIYYAEFETDVYDEASDRWSVGDAEKAAKFKAALQDLAQPSESPNAGGVKPCPWCGEVPDVTNDAHFGVDDAGKWGWLQCCGNGPEIRAGYMPLDEWRDDAIAAWNERKQPAPAALPVPDEVHIVWESHQYEAWGMCAIFACESDALKCAEQLNNEAHTEMMRLRRETGSDDDSRHDDHVIETVPLYASFDAWLAQQPAQRP